jgi:ribosomal protein S10
MAKNQNTYKIRVRLKSYDHRVIDEASRKILQTALSTGEKLWDQYLYQRTPNLLLF